MNIYIHNPKAGFDTLIFPSAPKTPTIPFDLQSPHVSTTMDAFGAVYIIENAQQFWAGKSQIVSYWTLHWSVHVELEEILQIPQDSTLSRLDSTLRSFISLCASYHGEKIRLSFQLIDCCVDLVTESYLQSPLQLEHSCDLLMGSELFLFHSERMCDLSLQDAEKVSNFPRSPSGQRLNAKGL